MASTSSNKQPTHNNNKSKKPAGWIRSCFGFGSIRKTSPMSDPSLEEAITTARSGRRMKGLGVLLRGVAKKPWCKKRDKTASLKAAEKGAEGSGRRGSEAVEDNSTASKLVLVVGTIQKALIDDELHETQWSIGGHIVKEFDIAKDVSPPTCQIQSKPIKEDTSSSHKTKVSKLDSKEHIKPTKLPSLAQVSSKQSHRKNKKGSNVDGIIGMSILITILMVMLLCGRLCAILCTAIWFYCMPQLTKIAKNNINNAEGSNSSEKLEIERKEVVFKGFLERKQNFITKAS